MARFLRSYGTTKSNNFMWKGFLYYGFTVPIGAVIAGFKTLLGVGRT